MFVGKNQQVLAGIGGYLWSVILQFKPVIYLLVM
jgi:hypothetical protein